MSLEERLRGGGPGPPRRGARAPGAARSASACAAEIEALDLDLVGRLVGELRRRRAPPAGRGRRSSRRRRRTSSRCRATEADRERERAAREAGEDAAARRAAWPPCCWPAARAPASASTAPRARSRSRRSRGARSSPTTPPRSRRCGARYGAALPWYVLTSPQNDAATRAIFADAGHFGLDAGVGALRRAGHAARGRPRRRGDPARGARTASRCRPTATAGCCRRCGALGGARRDGRRRASRRSSRSRSTTRCCRSAGRSSSATTAWRAPTCRRWSSASSGPRRRWASSRASTGAPAVVEYSDLPDELAQERDDDGELVYWAGSIAVHCIEVDFAARAHRGRAAACPTTAP